MDQDQYSHLQVLVVDDNRNFISIMRSILNGFGIKAVLEAQSAVEAFESLKSSQVDIAFVDYQMDDLDGMEFAHLIRNGEDSPNPYLPIIMVTADGKYSTVKKAIHSGIDDFLTKPIKPIDVLNRVKSAMQNQRRYIRSSTGYFGPDRRRRRSAQYAGPERRAADRDPKKADTKEVYAL